MKKPAERVWIAVAGLFKTVNGAQELTSDGRAILHENTSEVTPHLSNNPITIEGYSNTGMPDERHSRSRHRALEARDYLESRFKLNPHLVGVMPLRDKPPAAKGKSIGMACAWYWWFRRSNRAGGASGELRARVRAPVPAWPSRCARMKA